MKTGGYLRTIVRATEGWIKGFNFEPDVYDEDDYTSLSTYECYGMKGPLCEIYTDIDNKRSFDDMFNDLGLERREYTLEETLVGLRSKKNDGFSLIERLYFNDDNIKHIVKIHGLSKDYRDLKFSLSFGYDHKPYINAFISVPFYHRGKGWITCDGRVIHRIDKRQFECKEYNHPYKYKEEAAIYDYRFSAYTNSEMIMECETLFTK